MTIKKWQGLRDDLSDLSEEGMLTATNVSYRVTGECRRRPGLGDRITRATSDPANLITEWFDPFNEPYIVYKQVGTTFLYAYKLTASTHAKVASALSTLYRGCFSKSNGRLYWSNGFDAMHRVEKGFNDGTTTTAGINAPELIIGTPTSTTGSTTSGTHLLRYRYFDSKSLYMSDPSPSLSMSVTGTQTLTFSIGTSGTNIIRSTDNKVDQVIIEMTDSASSSFYRAATINQVLTGATVSMADADLVLQIPASRDGEFSHQPPPLATMSTEHRARLFAWGQQNVTMTGVTLATGASAGTASGVSMSSGWGGFLMLVDGDTKRYRIAAMSGTTKAILSEVYTGTAAVKTGVQFFSPTPDMLYWTRAGFPESWNTTSFARRVLQNQSDTPSGLHSFNEVLYLFGQRTIRGLDFASDPALGQIQQIASEMGLWNNNCLVEAAGYLWGWGRSGAWYLNGMLPVHISKGIDDTLETDVDVSKAEQFHGVYDPRERCINWFYCTSSDTYPKHAFTWDLDNQQMTLRTWRQALLASCLTTGGSTGITEARASDENGHLWTLKNDLLDGVPASMSGGVVTVYSATTTVVTVSGSTLSTGLVGVIATTSSGAERVISASTASTFTVSSVFAAAPSAGSEIYLGSIPVSLRSKWSDFGSLDQKKRPNHISVKLRPGSNASLVGRLSVGFYFDFSSSAHVFTKRQSDIDPDGVTITDGATTATVDFDGGSGDGVAYVPMSANWLRSVSVFVTSDRPLDVMKLIDISYVIKNGHSVVEVTDE